MSLSTYEQYKNSGLVASTPNNQLYTEDQIQAFLDSASAYIQSLCYQTLVETEYEEKLTVGNLYCSFSPEGWLNIFPKRSPIIDVDEVSYRTLPSGDFEEIDSDLYSVNDEGRIIVPYSLPIPRGRWAEIKVAYTAGYTTIPADLIEINNLVTAHFASGGYVAQNNQGETARGVVPNWAWGTGGKTKSIVDEVINIYQRRF